MLRALIETVGKNCFWRRTGSCGATRGQHVVVHRVYWITNIAFI